jgi:CheY-like chemotaxis protein
VVVHHNPTQDNTAGSVIRAAVVIHARLTGLTATTAHIRPMIQHALQYVFEKYGATVLPTADEEDLLAAFNVPNEVPVPGYLALMATLEAQQVFVGLRREMRQAEVDLKIGIDKGMVTYYATEPQLLEGQAVEAAEVLSDFARAGEAALTQPVYSEISMLGDSFKLVEQTELPLPPSEKLQPIYRIGVPVNKAQGTRTLESILPVSAPGSTVLVAEDDPALRSLFAKVLKNAGFNVNIAINGHEVIQQIERSMPQLIVVDLGLPGISGQDIIAYIRQHQGDRHVYIVVVTGNHQAMQSEVADVADLVFIKPVSPRDLVNFVKRFIH